MIRSGGIGAAMVTGCIAAAGALAGCSTPPAADNAVAQYDDAIYRAAVHTDKTTVAFEPITSREVEVVAWGSPQLAQALGDPPPHDVAVPEPLWVTATPALQQECARDDRGTLQLRLEQRLGLAPGAGAGRVFVTLRARAADLFRPCSNPSVESGFCSEDIDIERFRKRPEVAAFLLKHIYDSYRLPNGEPFTRLGYTYDWSPRSADHVGLPQLVVAQGATVTVLATTPIGTYCAQKPGAG